MIFAYIAAFLFGWWISGKLINRRKKRIGYRAIWEWRVVENHPGFTVIERQDI